MKILEALAVRRVCLYAVVLNRLFFVMSVTINGMCMNSASTTKHFVHGIFFESVICVYNFVEWLGNIICISSA